MDIYENNEAAHVPQQEFQDEERMEYKLQTDEPVNDNEAEKPASGSEKRRRPGRGILALVIALALVAGSCGTTAILCYSRLAAQEKRTEQLLTDMNQQIAQLQEELDSKSFTGNGNSVSGTDNAGVDGGMTPGQVYARAVDSVVAVTSEISVSDGTQVSVGTSYGSGFVLTADGYIVTNYHVVDGATKLTVTTNNGENYTAELCGYDSANDLAVLKVDARDLQPVTLGSSNDLIVGDQVAVIGNPLGDLTATLTVGYISGKDRVISTDGSLINMLQTDASVNSGNSGGPVFNMKGEVVGIITAKYSGTSSSGATIEGIGFAIPIDDVVKKISDLKEFGYITGAYLGVMVQDMDLDAAERYGLPMGVYVSSVTEGYCAEQAGVRAKDIIIGLGEYTVTGINSLTRVLQNFEAGDTTTITVWRSGLELELEITLDEKPHS